MLAGTTQVRAALGSDSSKVTTQQIEEALWHYYYDVGKSVAYLASKYISPKPAKPSAQKNKSGGRSPYSHMALFGTGVNMQRAGALGFERYYPYVACGLEGGFEIHHILVVHYLTYRGVDDKYPKHKSHHFLAEFFHDMPWLDIPNERRTTFIEPPRPRGGLLGGSASSGKMSKLQALAAARKKKAEEKRSGNQKLEIQKMQSSAIHTTPEPLKEPTKHTSGTLAERLSGRRDIKSLPIHTKAQTRPTSDRTVEDLDTVTAQSCISDLSTEDSSLDALIAAPSTLARTLFGPPTIRSAPVPRRQQCYELPYMRFFTSSVADAFSEPSPDDVVLAAQSKGSLLAKKV